MAPSSSAAAAATPPSRTDVLLITGANPISFGILPSDIEPALPSTTPSVLVRCLRTTISPYITDIIAHLDENHVLIPSPLPLVPGSGAIGRIVETHEHLPQLPRGQLVYINPVLGRRGSDEDENPAGPCTVLDGVNPAGSFAGLVRAPGANVHALDEARLAGARGYDVDDLAYLAWMAAVRGGLVRAAAGPGCVVLVAPANGILGFAAVNVAVSMGARVVALWSEVVDGRAGRAAGVGRGGGGTDGFPRVLGQAMENEVRAGRLLVGRMRGNVSEDTAIIRSMVRQFRGTAKRTVDAFVDLTGFGAETGPHFEAGVLSLRRGGSVCLMGAVDGVARLPYRVIGSREIRVTGSLAASREQIDELIRCVEDGHLRIGKLVGTQCAGVFQLKQWEEAFRVAARGVRTAQYTLLAPNGHSLEDVLVKGANGQK